MLAEASGDVGVGIGEDVRVDAQSEAGFGFELGGAGGEQGKFSFALNIELKNSRLECQVDFGGGFAYAGKDHAVNGFRCCSDHALEFAAGDDVEAGSV